MTTTAPETRLRERLIDALTAEFSTEGIKFLNDKLHDSKGREGNIGAVYPGPSQVQSGNELILEPTAYIQLFGKWTAEVDPDKTIDPTPIEEWAERIRRACQADGVEGADGDADEHLWFYSVTRIDYPPDPGGNISRLLVTVVGKAQNPALIQTTG
jgi:hypothetical protein